VETNESISMRALDAEEAVIEVVVTWGEGSLLEVAYLRPGQGYAAISTESAPRGASEVPLVRASTESAELDLPPGAALRGELGRTPDGRLVVSGEATAVIELGGLTYAVRCVRGARRVAGRSRVDRRPFAYAFGSALVHLLILGIFALEPPKAGALVTDVLDTRSRIVAHYLEAQEAPPEEPSPASSGATDGGRGGEGGEASAAGDPGRAPIARRRPSRGQASAPQEGPLDREAASRAGVLSVLGALPSAFGSPSPYASGQAIGTSAVDALGALLGTSPGERFGSPFGLGLTGTGSPGGDPGETIGVGPARTIGARGRPYGEMKGRCDGELCGRTSRAPQRITIGRPETQGALAAEVIRRVVHRHRGEIRFCYEQALRTDPGLEGRVAARFLISPTGAVASSMIGSSSLHHRGAEACIAQAVRRWSFPAPERGGVVTVTYPFVLRSGG
jgi:TonB family protein